jgi:hypothetical protein
MILLKEGVKIRFFSSKEGYLSGTWEGIILRLYYKRRENERRTKEDSSFSEGKVKVWYGKMG